MIDSQFGQGPFKFWRHEHHFSERNGKTLLTDKIEYRLPFGIIGRIIEIVFFKTLQRLLFSYRHIKTQEFFSRPQ